jgi:hypothetical protein
MRNFFSRLGILGELLGFMWRRRLFWLIPLVVTLMIIGVLILGGSSGLSPFIYSLI